MRLQTRPNLGPCHELRRERKDQRSPLWDHPADLRALPKPLVRSPSGHPPVAEGSRDNALREARGVQHLRLPSPLLREDRWTATRSPRLEATEYSRLHHKSGVG